MSRKNIRLNMAYDGTRYQGWQRQKSGATIQGVLEEKIGLILQEPVTLIGSGRTDSGVHAVDQVAHFLTKTQIAPNDLQRALNGLLPDDILISAAEYVPLEFHARYSARSKVYEYRIWNRPLPNLFERFYYWHIRKPLKIEIMLQCLNLLIGKHDFSAFRSSGSGNTNPVRQVLQAELKQSEQGRLSILIEADGFLRHMVRNIAGTVVEAGFGKLGVERFAEILASGDRCSAGAKAPAQGLFLLRVNY